MYYTIRSIVRWVFWITLSVTCFIVPFLLLPHVATYRILTGELAFVTVIWALVGIGTAPKRKYQARHRK